VGETLVEVSGATSRQLICKKTAALLETRFSEMSSRQRKLVTRSNLSMSRMPEVQTVMRGARMYVAEVAGLVGEGVEFSFGMSQGVSMSVTFVN
jgi:hypothetical protein